MGRARDIRFDGDCRHRKPWPDDLLANATILNCCSRFGDASRLQDRSSFLVRPAKKEKGTPHWDVPFSLELVAGLEERDKRVIS